MSRLIINIGEGVAELPALEMIKEVIRMGRISGNGKQYCYAAVFGSAAVYASITKAGTDVFHVRKVPDGSHED